MKLLISVGTRPNFIKITRFKSVAAAFGIDLEIVHTGQHYDQNMANVFFDQFDLRQDHIISLKGKESLRTSRLNGGGTFEAHRPNQARCNAYPWPCEFYINSRYRSQQNGCPIGTSNAKIPELWDGYAKERVLKAFQ